MSCPHITRRQFVAGATGLAIAATTSGCLGDDESPSAPDPVDLTDGQTCDVCGMVISEHYGPGAQVFYEDGPEDRDGPAWFDSVREMVAYDEEQRERGWEPIGYFVTDYSTVDYDIITENSDRFISSHVDAGDFVDAADATFVVDGPVQGAMGPDYLPFSDLDDASAFADAEGGDIFEWDELGP